MVKLVRKKPRRYNGRTTEELKAERRQRLLDAGLELFSGRGYANTPIELICSTAKVTTRHFYQQFEGREALLKALLLQILDEAAQRLISNLGNESEPLMERMTQAVRSGSDYLLEDPRRARIVCIEAIGVSSGMEALRRQIIHNIAMLVQQYCDRMAAEQLIPQRDYRLPSIALVGATLELLVEAVSEEGQLEPADFGRELILILRALQIGAQHYSEGAKRPG